MQEIFKKFSNINLLEQTFSIFKKISNFSSHARTCSFSYAVCANVSGTFLISLRFFASFLDNGVRANRFISRERSRTRKDDIYKDLL